MSTFRVSQQKDSENYVAITQGAGRSRALVEGGGRGANTLVERMVCCGNLLWRLMGRTNGMGNGIFFTRVGQFNLVRRIFFSIIVLWFYEKEQIIYFYAYCY
jgi:hypothetical protein